MNDPLLEKALAAGGHLADDVATVFVKKDIIRDARTGEVLEVRVIDLTADELAETLRSEHPELD